MFEILPSSGIYWKNINKFTKPNTNAGTKQINVSVTG